MHQVQGAGFVRYWPKTTKYQIAPSFTDLLTPSTDQYRPLLTQYYMYEPVPPSTTPVHSIFLGMSSQITLSPKVEQIESGIFIFSELAD